MMRVFSVFFHPDPTISAVGGAEKRFIETSKILTKKRFRMTVLEPKPSLLSKSGISCEIHELSNFVRTSKNGWIDIYFEWITWIFRACIKCLFLIRKKKYNLILAANNTVPNLLTAHFVRFVSHLPLCVVVHHVDVLSPDVNSSLISVYRIYRTVGFTRLVSSLKSIAFFVIIALLKRADTCIAVSNSTAKALVKLGLQKNRIWVSGNGVDVEHIKSFKVEGDKPSDGVFVGRVSREKGVFDLVKAWRQIVDVKTDARLLIIGSGPDEDKVKKLVSELDLDKNVVVMGRCSNKKMYALMKASRVFVFPSVFEGWGLAVAEALACGLPAVCYNIPALNEVFGDCQSVFLVPIGDIKKLAQTTLDVLRKNKTEKFAEISMTFVKRFDWKKVTRKDLEIIQNLLSPSHSFA